MKFLTSWGLVPLGKLRVGLLLFIIFQSAPPVLATDKIAHFHDVAQHAHILPKIGIAHQHNGKSSGILKKSTKTTTSAISTTTGDRALIINQPETVIINNVQNGGTAKKEIDKTTVQEKENSPFLKIISPKNKSFVVRGDNTIRGVQKNIAGKDTVWIYIKPNGSPRYKFINVGEPDSAGIWSANNVTIGSEDQVKGHPFNIGVFSADTSFSQTIIDANKILTAFPKDKLKAVRLITVYRK